MAVEKFVLTQKELHLGYLKETFRRGAVIEHDTAKRRLVIDGRRFEDTRDLDILKRQAMKNVYACSGCGERTEYRCAIGEAPAVVRCPRCEGDAHNTSVPFILPATQENVLAMMELSGETEAHEAELFPLRPKPGENMPVVRSDQDSMQPIDVRHTQVSKRKQEAVEKARTAVRDRDVNREMSVIRGDESVEDRIARLESEARARKAAGKPTDLSLQSQIVALKSKHASAAPIVRDDSLGSAGGSAASALNAGQPLPSPGTVRPKDVDMAQARKAQAEAARTRMMDEQEVDVDDLGAEVAALPVKKKPVQVSIPAAAAPAPEVEGRIGALETGMGQMAGMMGDMMRMMQNMQGGAPAQPAAPAAPAAREGDGIVRTPVTRVPVTQEG